MDIRDVISDCLSDRSFMNQNILLDQLDILRVSFLSKVKQKSKVLLSLRYQNGNVYFAQT